MCSSLTTNVRLRESCHSVRVDFQAGDVTRDPVPKTTTTWNTRNVPRHVPPDLLPSAPAAFCTLDASGDMPPPMQALRRHRPNLLSRPSRLRRRHPQTWHHRLSQIHLYHHPWMRHPTSHRCTQLRRLLQWAHQSHAAPPLPTLAFLLPSLMPPPALRRSLLGLNLPCYPHATIWLNFKLLWATVSTF